MVSESSSKKIPLIATIILLQLTSGLRKKYIPLLDEDDDLETFSIHRVTHFSSSSSRSTQGRTIYDLTLNSSSLPAANLEESTIGYRNTAEKYGAK